MHVENGRDDTCGGFQSSLRKPSHTNAKLSNMALLHLFSMYHSPVCGPGIAGGGISVLHMENWTKDSLNTLSLL